MQFDREGAKSLATAGQTATQSLQQQAAQVKSSLRTLPITITVTEILNCRGVMIPVLRSGCIKHASTVSSYNESDRK